jgi:hypothetical protein
VTAVEIHVLCDVSDLAHTRSEIVTLGRGEPLGCAIRDRLLEIERELEACGGYWLDWVPSHDSLPAFLGAARELAGTDLAARRLLAWARRAHEYVRSAVGGLDVWTPMPWLDEHSVHDIERAIGQYVLGEHERRRVP